MPLRVALVLPGAVSLGAYEAGALTALLKVVRASDGAIVVDTVAGASAGAVTGLLFAHALLTGDAADDSLRELWVDQSSVRNLLRGRRPKGQARGPMSTARLEQWASRALRASAGAPAQTEPVVFIATLASLRGLRYRIAQQRDRVVVADTFRDAKVHVLNTAADCAEAVPAAVVSAANAFAFPPILIRRKPEEYPDGITLTDEDTRSGFWYTDGGTVYTMPLGFALQAVFDPDEMRLDRPPPPGPRLVVVVHPHPSQPPARWPRQDALPGFFQTAIRALNMSREQTMYDDLRRAEKTNTRIRARADARDVLGDLVRDDATAAAAVAALAERWRRRRATIHEQVGTPRPADDRDALDLVLDGLTGTRGKGDADIHVVSPHLDPLGRAPADLLAGERAGHFYGFVDKGARESDFGLGYHHLRLWLDALRERAAPDVAHMLPTVTIAGHALEHDGDVRALPKRRRPRLPELAWLGARLAWRYAVEAYTYLRRMRRR